MLRAIGGKARAGTAAEAAASADVIVLSTPWPATEAAIRSMGNIKGKIILDATNPLTRGPDGIGLEIGHSISAGEKVQGWAAGASVFKTLNTTGFGNMANPVFNGVKSVMFVAGDDAANKPKVIDLVGELGFEVVDAGPLRNARLLEAHAMLWIDLALAARPGPRLRICNRETLRTQYHERSLDKPLSGGADGAEAGNPYAFGSGRQRTGRAGARHRPVFRPRLQYRVAHRVGDRARQAHLSLITVVTTGTPMVIEQIKNQLDRLVPVHRVVDMTLTGRSIERELAMVKVRGKGENRVEALRLADAFRARVIDATTESFVFEITGASDKIEQFVALMLPLGLVEVARTGIAAIVRGPEGMHAR